MRGSSKQIRLHSGLRDLHFWFDTRSVLLIAAPKHPFDCLIKEKATLARKPHRLRICTDRGCSPVRIRRASRRNPRTVPEQIDHCAAQCAWHSRLVEVAPVSLKRLAGKDFLLVKRFDRVLEENGTGWRCKAMVSALTPLELD